MHHGADVREKEQIASDAPLRDTSNLSSHFQTSHESSHTHTSSSPSTTSHSLLKLALLSRDLMTATLLYAAGASSDPADDEERSAISVLMDHTNHSAGECRVFKRFLVCFLCLRWGFENLCIDYGLPPLDVSWLHCKAIIQGKARMISIQFRRFYEPPTLLQSARRIIRRFCPSASEGRTNMERLYEDSCIPSKHVAYLRLHDFDSLNTDPWNQGDFFCAVCMIRWPPVAVISFKLKQKDTKMSHWSNASRQFVTSVLSTQLLLGRSYCSWSSLVIKLEKSLSKCLE